MRFVLLEFRLAALVATTLCLLACEPPKPEWIPPAQANISPTIQPTAQPLPQVDPMTKYTYADMSPTLGTVTAIPVRGRLIHEQNKPDPREATPLQQASQQELKGVEFQAFLCDSAGVDIFPLGSAKNDSEGYIDIAFPLKDGAVKPGHYVVDIRMKDGSVGKTKVQLLGNDHTGTVVRSDIDLTYLDTHFLHKRDMLKLLTQKGSERKTLPAMETVYQALRSGASTNEDRPLIFISGSPRFFKRILESKMEADGVVHNGILLKAFEEIAFTQVVGLDPERIVPALKEQVGYKLGHLLRGRLELPRQTAEILMGDDSEADFVVYSIYHRLMAGELDGESGRQEMLRGGVDAGQISELLTLATKVRQSLGGFSPVKAIYINLTGTPNAKLKVSEWPVPKLLRAHRGAWPLALDLHEEGFISKESVGAIRARLIELGATSAQLDDAANEAVKSGYLNKKAATL